MVIPALLLGWFIAKWAPYIGISTGDTQEGLVWVSYTLAGFIPVYLAAKVAPSRQLPLAIVCALLVAAWHISLCVVLLFHWRDGSTSGGVSAFVLGYNFASVAGAASAVWLVKRKRAADPEGGSTWARATGLMLPVALFAYIGAEGFIT